MVSLWQLENLRSWLAKLVSKDIDQVTLSPKPPSSKMSQLRDLDFIVSQLDPDKVTFKNPCLYDRFSLCQSAFKNAINQMSSLTKAMQSMVVQDQLDCLKELWERVVADDSLGQCPRPSQSHLLYDNQRGV